MGAGHSNDDAHAVHASTRANSADKTGGSIASDPAWRTGSDEAFLTDCDFEAFRASGPGGQKRNKTSSAVRLTHRPSGLSAIANESRSQHDNRRTALRRLRHKVALTCREAVGGSPASLDVSLRSVEYLKVLGCVFDVLAESGWSVSDAGKILGVTTGALVGFVQRDEKALAHLNAQRARFGLKALGAR